MVRLAVGACFVRRQQNVFRRQNLSLHTTYTSKNTMTDKSIDGNKSMKKKHKKYMENINVTS